MAAIRTSTTDGANRTACSFQVPYLTWKSLNRLRIGFSRYKANLVKWEYLVKEAAYECGLTQADHRLLICKNLGDPQAAKDLPATDKVTQTADFGKYKI